MRAITSNTAINIFYNDLQYSYSLSNNTTFNKFYYSAFPDLVGTKFITEKEEQLKGYDRRLYFGNGKEILIDEKKRRKVYGDEPDIFIEVWSNSEWKKAGWLYTSQADFIAYFIEPIETVYLLNTLLLRMAWVTNKTQWKKDYGEKEVINYKYTTVGVCVPVVTLIEAMKQESIKHY